LTTANVPVASPVLAPPSWLERWSPIGGLLFVIGALAVAFTPAGDDVGETAAEVVQFARDNEEWMVVAMLFALASLLLVGWFVAGLYLRLRRAGADTEAVLTLVGGTLFAVLFFLAITIWTATLVDMEEGNVQALAQGATYLAIDDVGWVALGGAGVSAGLMAITASLGALRLGMVPAWAGWLGVLLGVAALATVAFFGIFAWLAWILIVSVGLLWREMTARA
jgi:hypothetical protein